MLFHTWTFLIFFLITYPVYLFLRKNNSLMNLWLMVASYVFYGWWNPYYVFLLFGSSALDYFLVRLMSSSRSDSARKMWLVVSLISNFGLLGIFKYAGFASENINILLQWFHIPKPIPEFHLLLPIGISFHTFQSMSYTIDAYRRRMEPEPSFVRFLTFVSFFPLLVAGPIERASNLIPQLQSFPRITKRDCAEGSLLFLVGLFKKVALADFLSSYVNMVYERPGEFQSAELLMATFAFAWQIYFDFSGYTDMARGIAQVMGFRLRTNFNSPYVSTGLGDFWERWHISLSSWFRDYVYFPLGGSKGTMLGTYRNMILTMIISGIWHGAAWTFVVWGALHALGRACTRELERSRFYRDRIPSTIKRIGVFGFVCLAWIFFRAKNASDAFLILGRIFSTSWETPNFPPIALILILLVWAYQLLRESGGTWKVFAESLPIQAGLVGAMVVYLVVAGRPSTQQFIYFQF